MDQFYEHNFESNEKGFGYKNLQVQLILTLLFYSNGRDQNGIISNIYHGDKLTFGIFTKTSFAIFIKYKNKFSRAQNAKL